MQTAGAAGRGQFYRRLRAGKGGTVR